MRAVFLTMGVCGAVACDSGTCDVDADVGSLLQAQSLVRRHQRSNLVDAHEVLQSLQNVANSLTDGSDVSMTPEEVTSAVGAANSALETMFPAFADQHRLAQQELADAIRTVEACHDEHGGELRVRLEQTVATQYAAKEECDESLGQAMQAESEACEGQGQANADCACNEARTVVADNTALCDSRATSYELAFCEHQLSCDMLHGCYEREVGIYNDIRTDVEAAMISRQLEYRTARQAGCLMELIISAMTSGTPIPHDALTSCSDVSIEELVLVFPTVPVEPDQCPDPHSDDPQCHGEIPVTCSWALPSDWGIEATSHWDANYQPDNVKVHGGHPWHSGRANSLPQDLSFDAGREVTLSGFATAHPTGWAGSAMQDYTLSRSDDGVHFSEVVSGTGTNLAHGQRQEIEFDAVTSQHWRLHMTSNHGYGNYLTDQYVEFKFCRHCVPGFEWVLPGDWSITATSHWDANYQPDNVKVHEGHPWHTGRANTLPQDLFFDAGQEVTLSGFATAHPTGWAGSAMQEYTLSRSDDGVHFSEVVSGTGTNLAHSQRQEIEFDAATSQHWRLHMTSNHGYGNYLTAQYVEFRAHTSCLQER